MTVGSEIKELILKGETGRLLYDEALRGGMKPLRDAGITSALEGHTTIEEVISATI